VKECTCNKGRWDPTCPRHGRDERDMSPEESAKARETLQMLVARLSKANK
jgi:hypothetical protein